MTYPQQYQQQPPQQYGAPQSAPWMPPQQAQAFVGQIPPAAAPPQGGQSLPTSAPALGQTRGAGGAVSPKARNLVGRTIIIEPIRVDENAKDDKGNPRPEAYFHLTVCDGGPLEYADSQDRDPAKQHGPTKRVDVPARFTNVNDYGYGFVNEVRDALARGDLAAVGVFEQGTQGNKPYLLTKPGRDLAGNDRPDGDQRFQLAGQIWQSIFDKTFRSPEPVSLVAPPAQAPQQVAYAQPAAPQQAYAYPPVATYGGTPGQGYAQAYAGAQQLTAEVQGYGYPPASQYPYQPQGYNPAAYAAPAPVSAPAAAPQQQPAQDPQYLAWLASQQQAGGQQAGPPAPGI